MSYKKSGDHWTAPVVVVGFGQFGRALATLLLEAGVEVRAVDPFTEVPEHFRSQGDPFAGARETFVCVPVWAFYQVLTELRPRLGPGHVVVDVSSVRSGPDKAMRELLGSDVPWVGTHPLFGPSSVALGERPLRVVVAPNELHPGAATQVADLYEHIGCEVKQETADEHDRRMAYSHALAFFVAKALMDMDAPTDAAFVPPSFRWFARTVESVRTDAGHLFLSIQNLNPHAAQARDDLLACLARVNSELRQVDPSKLGSLARPALDIPDLGSAAPALRETRDLIDDVDHELLRQISRRATLALRAGRIKREHGSSIRDPERERELLADRRIWAAEEGLDPAAVARVFEALMELARSAQDEEH